MLLSTSYELWAISSSGKPINFTRFVVNLKLTEGLNASRSQIKVTLAPEAKTSIQNVKKGGEWQLLWGYGPQVYRKVSAYWVGTEWSIGGSNLLGLTLVNLGQYQLSRGTVTRAIGMSTKAVAALKGVKLKAPVTETGKQKSHVISQVPLKEILRENRESFVKWGFDSQATAEVVKFADLGTKAQVHYISTLVGFIGEIKISYNAQLPKDQSFLEIAGKGTTSEAGPLKGTPQASTKASAFGPEPQPSTESKETYGLLSYYVQNLEGGELKALRALSSPSAGTSVTKLFVALVVRAQVLSGKYAISSQWQGATVAALLRAMLDQSSNEAANKLIARVGGIEVLNQGIKALGFTRTGFKTLYGKSTVLQYRFKELNWNKYRLAANAAGYLETYSEASAQGLNPAVTTALRAMREASGLALPLVSGFRSFTQQEQLWLQKPEATRADFSAPPGYSQHHTGLAVDLVTVGTPSAAEGAQLAWLKANAQKYGFIFPYLNTSGDLGPGQEPWHLVWVGNAEAMGVFHEFIARALTLGYNPLSPSQEKLFNSAASLEADKESCIFEVCKAMSLLLKGTDAVSKVAQDAMSGSYIGLEGENIAKVGFTDNVWAVCIQVEGRYILGAYAPTHGALIKGVKALAVSLSTKSTGSKDQRAGDARFDKIGRSYPPYT
jgi:D-alanyl-D-alanine carboxypeptidase/Beta-lactamase enzyme family